MTTYNVWAQMPQFVGGKHPWSLIATRVTDGQAEVYQLTFKFPIHIEETNEEEK